MIASLRRLSPDARFALALVLVGLLAAAFATAFRLALSKVFEVFFQAPDVVEAVRSVPPAARVTLPAAGGLLAGLVALLASKRPGGHGVAEVMEAVTLGRVRVSLSATLLKALASFLALASGGSLGREGPLILFGAASGNGVASGLGLDEKRARALIAAGTAAGFAAAYNTPLAGIIFVLEIVTGLVALRVVLPVVLVTVLATLLTRVAAGAGPLYGLRNFSLDSGAELVGYAALGALAGLLGAGFMALLRGGAAVFERIPVPPPVRGALGGLGVGVLALALPEVAGNGYEVIQGMLDGRFGVAMLAMLLIAKSAATVSSVSSGSPGGVFTPTMFLGAALGGLLGQIADAISGTHASGGYVLVGMAALTAATTHAPLMATVLGFELSGDYGVVLPLLLGTAFATAVSRRVSRESIYTSELIRRGIPWEGTLSQRLARAVRARDILEMDPLSVDGDLPASRAVAMLQDGRSRVIYILSAASPKVIDLRMAARFAASNSTAAVRASDLAVAVPSVAPDATLLELSEKLWSIEWGELPVVDPREPSRLMGTVSRRAILGALDRELLQRDLLYTRVVTFEGASEVADYLELPPGYRVEVIAPPANLVGRTIDPCRLRAQSRVNIIGLRRAGAPHGQGSTWSEPDSAVLQATDRLLVLGPADAIEHFRAETHRQA